MYRTLTIRRLTPILTSHIIGNSYSTAIPTVCRLQRRLLTPTQTHAPYILKQPVRYFTADEFVQRVDAAIGENTLSNYFTTATQNDIVFYIQDKLIEFHDFSGLPWWGVIICATTVLRLSIFPLAVHQQHVVARLERVNKEMDTTAKKKVTAEIRKLMDEKNLTEKQIKLVYGQKLSEERDNLIQKYNCHPMKNIFLVLCQLPAWTFMSGAIRNIYSMIPVQDVVAYTAYLEMKASGFLFLKDLTIPDESFVLPILLGLMNYTIIQTNQASRKYKYSRLRNIIVLFMKGICFLSVGVCASVPKCLSLYWVTSSFCGLLQNLAFMSPACRRVLRIPDTSSNVSKPFQRMRVKFKYWINFWRY